MRNGSWERWGGIGIALGLILVIFGLVIQALEISRIYKGPANRGDVNFTSDAFIRPSFLFEGNQFSEINQRDTMWPWSFPGLWFGILLTVAGIMGIVAGRHRTYGSILGFAVMCLLAAASSAFVIGYYSVIVYFYNTRFNESFTDSQKFAARISRALISFVVFSTVASLLAALIAGLAIGMCRPKGRNRQRPIGPELKTSFNLDNTSQVALY
ncbi:hypothetical protein GJ496_000756 [Pomphorhynchus laevis]|nr:hypothetical protein GJ496_000756 [Pomphorhynchus laevis]